MRATVQKEKVRPRRRSERQSARGAMPVPRRGERPTVYADRVGVWYVESKSDAHRKAHGLYLTPVPAADFMAARIQANGSRLRILDPAAGAGILCCAAIEALLSRNAKPDAVELIAHEVDQDLIAPLRAVLDYLSNWCRSHGARVSFEIKASDFVMAHAETLCTLGQLFPSRSEIERFHIVISNPPYFKIGKTDPRARAASAVVHGQPNIYALFMAIGGALLREQGDFIFITPRSFTSGSYFRRFRKVFFGMIRPTNIHVFGSRRNAFSRDEVLQENITVSGIREDRWRRNGDTAPLLVSSSRGIRDLGESDERDVAMSTALDLASEEKVLRLPVRDEEAKALALMDSWPNNLQRLGLNISTGPVVPFRAKEFIDQEGAVPENHVPLLWMNHVRAMQTTWPLASRKPEYIQRTHARALLAPNRNYVLLRRFSAKEEARRLTAAPYIAERFDVPQIGFENHLNYVHRPGGTLSEDEAWGLAALFNSRLLDAWFRTVSGNTQVSATELRAMPLPPHHTIIALGQRIKHLPDPMQNLDAAVMERVVEADRKEVAIAWETEVWLCDAPDHMIHYNGDRFLGPRRG